VSNPIPLKYHEGEIAIQQRAGAFDAADWNPTVWGVNLTGGQFPRFTTLGSYRGHGS